MNLKEILHNLEKPRSEGELSSIDIVTNYQSGGVVLALDNFGALHCLFEFSSEIEFERLSNGFTIRSRNLLDQYNGQEKYYLDLCWNNPFESRLFEAVVDEITDLKITQDALIAAIRNKVKKWDYLLSEVKDSLTNSEAIGLFGELLVLDWLLENQLSRTISCWTGPLGMPHDFEISSFSLEVKTSLAENEMIHISNMDQLATFDNKPLYLFKIDICESSDGISAAAIISENIHFKSNNADLKRYLELIAPNFENQVLLNVRYKVIRIQVFKIDSDFPRITRFELSQISNGHAIQKIQYSLDLSTVSPISNVDSLSELKL